MKILVEEAAGKVQANALQNRVAEVAIQVRSQSLDSAELIENAAWSLLLRQLTERNMSLQAVKRKDSLTDSVLHKLSGKTLQSLEEKVAQVVSEYGSYQEGSNDKQEMISTLLGDDMKQTVLSLQDHFYITSENHFPARWASYEDSIYCSRLVESDTPTHAMPTYVAQALGIQFYRAFSFALDDALLAQNFRSGYKREYFVPPSFATQSNSGAQHRGVEEAGTCSPASTPVLTPKELDDVASITQTGQSSPPLESQQTNPSNGRSDPQGQSATPSGQQPSATQQETGVQIECRKATAKQNGPIEDGRLIETHLPTFRTEFSDEGEALWLDVWNHIKANLPLGQSPQLTAAIPFQTCETLTVIISASAY